MNKTDLQFVIHEHATQDGGHWDLMLQGDNSLLTWRLRNHPQRIQADPILVEKITDHPLKFLTYEGPVQAHTGLVKIIDGGSFEIIEKKDREITFKASGNILKGQYLLQLEQNENWLLSRIG